MALLTSTINIAVLTRLNGHELGWICLASCGMDVTVNALVLDFVTESRLKRSVRLSRTRSRAANHGVNVSGAVSTGYGGNGNGVGVAGVGTSLSSGLATSSSTPHQLQSDHQNGRRHRAKVGGGVRRMVKSGVYVHGTTHSVELPVSLGGAGVDIEVDMVAGTEKSDSATDASGLLPPGSLSYAVDPTSASAEEYMKTRDMKPQASSSRSTTVSMRPLSTAKDEDDDGDAEYDWEARVHTPTPLATPTHLPVLAPLRFARPHDWSPTSSQEGGMYDEDDEMSSGDEFDDFQRTRHLPHNNTRTDSNPNNGDDSVPHTHRPPDAVSDPSSAPPRLLTFDEALRAVEPSNSNSYLNAHSISNCNSSTFSNSTNSNRDTHSAFNSTFGSSFNQFIVRPPPASASLFHPSGSRRPSTSPNNSTGIDRSPLPRPLSLTGFKFGTAGSGSAGPNPSIPLPPPSPTQSTLGLRGWPSRLAFSRKRPSTAPDASLGAGPRRSSDGGFIRGRASILPTHVHAPLGMSSDWGVDPGASSSSSGGIASWRRRMSMPMTADEIVLDDLFETPGPPRSPRAAGRKGKDVHRGAGATDLDGPAGLSRLFSVARPSRQPQPTPLRLTPLRDSAIVVTPPPDVAAVSEPHIDTKVVVGGAG